jgi:hypothetical protein
MIIRQMALGKIPKGDFSVVVKEAWMGLVLGVMMFAAGFLRVYVFQQEVVSTLAVAGSQFIIVVSSIIIGATLPLLLDQIGLDPAHAGPMIQVVMDVSGVLITCAVCSYMVGIEEPATITAVAEGANNAGSVPTNRLRPHDPMIIHRAEVDSQRRDSNSSSVDSGSKFFGHSIVKHAARQMVPLAEDQQVVDEMEHLLMVTIVAIVLYGLYLVMAGRGRWVGVLLRMM